VGSDVICRVATPAAPRRVRQAHKRNHACTHPPRTAAHRRLPHGVEEGCPRAHRSFLPPATSLLCDAHAAQLRLLLQLALLSRPLLFPFSLSFSLRPPLRLRLRLLLLSLPLPPRLLLRLGLLFRCFPPLLLPLLERLLTLGEERFLTLGERLLRLGERFLCERERRRLGERRRSRPRLRERPPLPPLLPPPPPPPPVDSGNTSTALPLSWRALFGSCTMKLMRCPLFKPKILASLRSFESLMLSA